MKSTNRLTILAFSAVFFAALNVHAYYDPRIGRWASRDPIGEHDMNVYAFVHNQPVNGYDRLGLLSQTITSSMWTTKDASSVAVTYPKKGQYPCVCGGKNIGINHLRYAWIDADPYDSIQSYDKSLYDWVTSNFSWNSGALNEFNNAFYIGAGIAVEFAPNKYGKACCSKISWHQDKKGMIWGWNDDGTFTGNVFVDSPGGLLNKWFGTRSQTYRLRLLCDGEVAAEYRWSYRGNPSGPTITLNTPF